MHKDQCSLIIRLVLAAVGMLCSLLVTVRMIKVVYLLVPVGGALEDAWSTGVG